MRRVGANGSIRFWGWVCLWAISIGCSWNPSVPEPVAPVKVQPVLAYGWGDLTTEELSHHLAQHSAMPPAESLVESPSSPSKSPARHPEDLFFIHVISGPGETLIAIARWYTGESRNWKTIAAANPNLKPRQIHVGDRVRIPKSLLITRKPLPRIEVAPKPPSTSPTPTPPSPEKAAPVEVELFGPIVTSPAAAPVTLEPLD